MVEPCASTPPPKDVSIMADLTNVETRAATAGPARLVGGTPNKPTYFLSPKSGSCTPSKPFFLSPKKFGSPARSLFGGSPRSPNAKPEGADDGTGGGGGRGSPGRSLFKAIRLKHGGFKRSALFSAQLRDHASELAAAATQLKRAEQNVADAEDQLAPAVADDANSAAADDDPRAIARASEFGCLVACLNAASSSNADLSASSFNADGATTRRGRGSGASAVRAFRVTAKDTGATMTPSQLLGGSASEPALLRSTAVRAASSALPEPVMVRALARAGAGVGTARARARARRVPVDALVRCEKRGGGKKRARSGIGGASGGGADDELGDGENKNHGEAIDLSGRGLGNAAAPQLAGALAAAARGAVSLTLARNRLSGEPFSRVLEALAKRTTNERLLLLHLGDNDLRGAPAAALAHALARGALGALQVSVAAQKESPP